MITFPYLINQPHSQSINDCIVDNHHLTAVALSVLLVEHATILMANPGRTFLIGITLLTLGLESTAYQTKVLTIRAYTHRAPQFTTVLFNLTFLAIFPWALLGTFPSTTHAVHRTFMALTFVCLLAFLAILLLRLPRMRLNTAAIQAFLCSISALILHAFTLLTLISCHTMLTLIFEETVCTLLHTPTDALSLKASIRLALAV